ncbi:hypothetical protein [Gelidibacter salicanalis]|uniref:DUF4136 domain-containing protein n=1 Tax=Gelidibacter salicanalis TaxID=291193 RepID=A0A934NI15_9FLAO|nr:hypothetical protein [Gelidibacter salicanalis]MBJ7881506.1 hypothetical protein [Gelidibacter salicanalis]
MKSYLYVFMLIGLLISCKGNGQTTDIVSTTDVTNPEGNFVFSGDYNDLLSLEMASRITGFYPSKAQKMNTTQGMLGEVLRYYWDNGREKAKESTAPNRKNTDISSTMDLVQLKWVDGEADMDSFLDFIDLDNHPELSKVNGVGEGAYWNSKKHHLEVYYNGVSFTLQVDMSNDDNLDKEKTIALAKAIIEEQMN